LHTLTFFQPVLQSVLIFGQFIAVDCAALHQYFFSSLDYLLGVPSAGVVVAG
jgi:hypothetical protein